MPRFMPVPRLTRVPVRRLWHFGRASEISWGLWRGTMLVYEWIGHGDHAWREAAEIIESWYRGERWQPRKHPGAAFH